MGIFNTHSSVALLLGYAAAQSRFLCYITKTPTHTHKHTHVPVILSLLLPNLVLSELQGGGERT